MTDPNKAPNTYTIGGVTVQFPHKAYPSQMAMMDKIFRWKNGQKSYSITKNPRKMFWAQIKR